MKDCGKCRQAERTAEKCCKCLGYTKSGKLSVPAWEPRDDTLNLQKPLAWWGNYTLNDLSRP